jgi:hypothetical protein
VQLERPVEHGLDVDAVERPDDVDDRRGVGGVGAGGGDVAGDRDVTTATRSIGPRMAPRPPTAPATRANAPGCGGTRTRIVML